jgi:hypothetical protein
MPTTKKEEQEEQEKEEAILHNIITKLRMSPSQ